MRLTVMLALTVFCTLRTSTVFGANDPRFAELSLADSVQLASTLSQIQAKKAELDQAIAILNKSPDQIVGELTSDPVARSAVLVYLETFADRLIEQTRTSEAFKTFYGLQADIKQIEEKLKKLKERLRSAQQRFDDLKTEIEQAKSLIQSYQLLLSSDSVLAFANNQLSRSLKEPIQFKVGAENVSIQIVEGTERILSDAAKISVKVQYGGGLSATLKGIKVDLTDPSKPEFVFPNPPQVQLDESSLKSAAAQLFGQFLGKLDLPFPIAVEDIKPSGSAGIPKLSAKVVLKVPGLEFLTETIGGSIGGTLEIPAGDISSPEAILRRIEIKDPFKFQGPPGTNIVIPGTPLALKIPPGFELYINDRKLIITAEIVPADPSNVGAGVVTLEIKVDLRFAGSPKLPISGALLVGGQPIGKFEIEVSGDGMSGSLAFPHPDLNAPGLERIYNGVFSFKMDKKGLQADGLAAFLQVVKLNLDMFLSLDPRVDSFLIASQTLSIDGIQGKADFAGHLTNRMKNLHIATSVWFSVDLGIAKPEARVDITANCDDTSKLPIAGALAFNRFNIRANAMGISVQFDVDDIKDITLARIEQELRRQLDDMFNRLSKAAADYERDKRELFSRWERHWAETISKEAQKYGIDAIRTGNKDVDELLGNVASGAKNAGHVLSDLSKGAGGAVSDARDGVGKAYTRIVKGLSRGFGVSDKASPFRLVSFAQANPPSQREQFENTWREWIRIQRTIGSTDIKAYSDSAKDLIDDDGLRTQFANEMKTLLDHDDLHFGTKIQKAILENEITAPTQAEIAFANTRIAEMPLFVALDIPPDPTDAFVALVQKLKEHRVIRSRTGGSSGTQASFVMRQLGLTFDDIYVEHSPTGGVTVALVAQIAGTETKPSESNNESRITAASNVIPVIMHFDFDQRLKGKYRVRLDIPNPTSLTEKQLDWILEQHDKLTVGEPTPETPRPAEFKDPKAAFDFRAENLADIFSSGDRAQKKQRLEALIAKVFGTDTNASAAFNVDGIIRVALQSVVVRTIGPVEFVGSTGFTEKTIAIQNATADPVKVHLKVRKRRITGGEFAWDWLPSPPAASGSFTFEIPANTTQPIHLHQDLNSDFDDFGGNAPELSGSRIRLQAESTSGEIWDFTSQDIFLVDLDESLGSDRIYQAQSIQGFVFTIQSRYIHPPQQVILFKDAKATVLHKGDVPRQFKIPIGSGNTEALLQSLRIESPRTGNVFIDSQPWDWDATVSSQTLHSLGDPSALRDRYSGRTIDVTLFPTGRLPDPKPGQVEPLYPVKVTYEHSSQPWKAVYQLHLAAASSPRHFDSALRGLYLYENITGIDWKSTNVVLADHDGTPAASLPATSLQRQSAQLKPQDRLPIPATVKPYLVYKSDEECSFPQRKLVILNKSDDPQRPSRRLPEGRLIVMAQDKPGVSFDVPSLESNESTVIPYPGTIDDRVCIKQTSNRDLEVDYEGLCLRGECLEYVAFSRKIEFEANFSSEYSSREPVALLIALPAIQCWQAVETEVEIGNQLPKQKFLVRQYRDGTWNKSVIDLCYAPLQQIVNLHLHDKDHYAKLVADIVELRKANQLHRAKQLLCMPDLIIDSVNGDCCVIHEGSFVERKVRIRNLGGGHAEFRKGDVIVSGKGFEDIIATQYVSFPPCCTREFTVHATQLAPSGTAKFTLEVDPKSKVSEFNENNNEYNFQLN